MEWFSAARYGLFVHWGPYSVAGRGEWVANRECIPFEEYRDRYAAAFTAENYDPAEWARLAKRGGMKYVVLTTRHHDGFCLWDTATTDFQSAKIGACRDLLRPFVEAVRAEGLRVGFYYSVADWFHADYPTPYARDWTDEWASEDARRGFASFVQAQMRELMTNYGRIDVLWYDGGIPALRDGGDTNRLAKELQPGILINERNGEPFDFRCSEQSLSAKQGPWEACMTLNDNWGWHVGDTNWKTPADVVRMLLTTAGSAGNLLLNVGPRGDGRIPEASVRIIEEAGRWVRRHHDILADSDRSPFSWNNSALITTKGRQVFVHLIRCPGDEFCLAEIGNEVLSARWQATGEPVEFEQCGERLFLRGLSDPLPDSPAATITLQVAGEPRPLRTQETFWIPG